MAGLLFYGSSKLMAGQISGYLPGVEIHQAGDDQTFFSILFGTRPVFVIIGDPGPRRPLQLILAIRDAGDFFRLPLVYFGEDELASMFPVLRHYSFSEEDLEKMAGELPGLYQNAVNDLSPSVQNWAVPPDLAQSENVTPAVCHRARKRMEKSLTEDLFESVLPGVATSDSDMEEAVSRLQAEFCRISSAAACYLAITVGEETRGYVYFRRYPASTRSPEKIDPDSMNELWKLILKSSPQKFWADREGLRVNRHPAHLIFDDPARCQAVCLVAEEVELFFSIHAYYVLIDYRIAAAGELPAQPAVELPENLGLGIPEFMSHPVSSAHQYYNSLERTDLIYKTFSQFLPAQIIDDLLQKQSERALMTGEKRSIVVLFSHIRDFDYLAEHNPAEKVVEFLNDHFSRMVSIIVKFGGTIDKFIGDAVFAIFGAPVSHIDNALRAARASAEMIQRYHDINIADIVLPPDGFSIGIGLHEGEAIIGNIGCTDKFDYTAIGDTVNLAARLESLCKHYHQSILISRQVFEHINEHYLCRKVDRAKVKGKAEATDIYSILLNPNMPGIEWLDQYQRGMSMMKMGNWILAADFFRSAASINPSDPLCPMMLERCLEYQANEPENWDGAYTLNFK